MVAERIRFARFTVDPCGLKRREPRRERAVRFWHLPAHRGAIRTGHVRIATGPDGGGTGAGDRKAERAVDSGSEDLGGDDSAPFRPDGFDQILGRTDAGLLPGNDDLPGSIADFRAEPQVLRQGNRRVDDEAEDFDLRARTDGDALFRAEDRRALTIEPHVERVIADALDGDLVGD
jgi:hypothetical protein